MKKLLIGSTIVLAIAGATSYTLTRPSSTSATDEPPIVQTVNRHEEELANHEARITNTENDVKDLQGNTNTPPSTNRVTVPPVSQGGSNAPEGTPPTDNTVRVTTATQRTEDMPKTDTQQEHKDFYCDLTYSDGSSESLLVGRGYGPNPSPPTNCQEYVGKAK